MIIDTMESYKNLRRFIGGMAFALPILCVIGGLLFSDVGIKEHISSYYYSNMRDLVVGILVAIGIFLITYKGYSIEDNVVTTISGICSIGIAFFPCSTIEIIKVGIFQIGSNISVILHCIFAIVFFMLLAYNSYFLFTKTGTDLSDNKKIRNTIYRTCGVLILVASLLQGVCTFLNKYSFVKDYSLMLIFEIVILFSFGVSWFVKGETIFKDRI